MVACHVCRSMKDGGRTIPSTRTAPTSRCILCDRDFCDAHKSGNATQDAVCEINHVTYYGRHPHAKGIYATMDAWKSRRSDTNATDTVLEEDTVTSGGQGQAETK
nr:hypothetical protein CFP56_52528 [Quercus suber]